MTVGLGLVGLGTAGAAMLSAALHRSDLRLAAVADVRIDALAPPGLDGVRRYATIDALLGDNEVQAVHIATPTPMHQEHVAQALQAGRHVIVEKPVTCDSESADTLIALAERHDRVILVGHSESFEPYVRAGHDVIDSGEIGDPVMVMAEKFTDWMRRPRLPEELEPVRGGGLIRRQGVHQVDVVRTLADSRYAVRTARTRPDPHRSGVGSYCAWLAGAGSTEAFIAHDGIGRLRAAPARVGRTSGDGEVGDKQRRSRRLLEQAIRNGGALDLGRDDGERVLVLGTDGEVTARRGEVAVTGRDGRRTVALGGYTSGRDAVLDELMGAISGERATVHDLAWGAENLRLCEEIERVAYANRPMEMRGTR